MGQVTRVVGGKAIKDDTRYSINTLLIGRGRVINTNNMTTMYHMDEENQYPSLCHHF